MLSDTVLKCIKFIKILFLFCIPYTELLNEYWTPLIHYIHTHDLCFFFFLVLSLVCKVFDAGCPIYCIFYVAPKQKKNLNDKKNLILQYIELFSNVDHLTNIYVKLLNFSIIKLFRVISHIARVIIVKKM